MTRSLDSATLSPLGRLLSRYRARQGWSWSVLAERVGTPYSTLLGWTRPPGAPGARCPDEDTLARLAERTGLELAALLAATREV